MSKIPTGWHSAVRRLKKEMPPPLPVSVRTVERIPGKWADTTHYGDRAVIRVTRTIYDYMLDLLAHEWGHVMDNWHDGTKPPHNAAFAVHANDAYKILFETD